MNASLQVDVELLDENDMIVFFEHAGLMFLTDCVDGVEDEEEIREFVRYISRQLYEQIIHNKERNS